MAALLWEAALETLVNVSEHPALPPSLLVFSSMSNIATVGLNYY